MQFNFPSLSGYDASGAHWTGAMSFTGDGSTTFEGQSVTKSVSTVTLQAANGSPATTTITSYYLALDGSLYKTVYDNGATYTPASQVAAPTSAKVGDSGDLAAATRSDGTTKTVHWALNPDFDGAVQLVVTAVIKTGAVITSNEVDTIYLNSSGTPTRIAVSIATYGTTSGHPLLTSLTIYGNAQ
ncbi:hypothetical protein FO488_03395 [Geobacter sp. FeAm09]|uniref:hypothetical protein n=1 Tax=Geobacter sp. FeAm09 TaxID=2597769 RepID=UPI0011EF3BFD|nr:hypothetical protein [Geobacter sp. FeAm09]QEM67289.1 hypothetical protein FO488_03395 [Geobacter sp. FeAm09]